MDERGRGSFKIPRRNFFCVTRPKRLVGEPLCAVFQKICGSEKFVDKREGKCHDLRWNIPCLTLPKKFVWEPFRVSLTSGNEKSYA